VTDIFPGAKLMQVVEWGYPMGSMRPVPPASKAFSVVHITANLAIAENEAAWRIRDTGLQNSATFFVNRDGSAVQLLGDPLRMDPWANGDVRTPDTTNPRIAAMVLDGVNANERTLVAIENVGNEVAWGSVPGGYPITAAQEATNARIIAYYHAKAGVPVSRETVIGHYQLNRVSRANCPSVNKALLDRIVTLAQPSEDDMPQLTTYALERITIGFYANIRSAPSLNGELVFNTTDESEATRVGTITNAEDAEWSVYYHPGRKQWLYTAKQNVVKVEPLPVEVVKEVPGDCTAAISAAVDPLNERIRRGKEAAVQIGAVAKALETVLG
jgi:hypothetical protein